MDLITAASQALEQWRLYITEYAQDDIENIDTPEKESFMNCLDAIEEAKIMRSLGIPQKQNTTSDYAAALKVWDEFGNNGKGLVDSQFGYWCQQRLNSNKNKNCA